MDKLLPDRYPNQDFFIADILDAAPKSDMASMEHPIFSLSKTPDKTVHRYSRNGVFIEVQPSANGLANIWDKDLLIYVISQLREGINRGKHPQPIVHFKAYDYFVATNKQTSGRSYDQLKKSLERLAGTRILTNIETANEEEVDNFGLIVQYKIQRDKTSKHMSSIAVELPRWIYRAVISAEVLTLDRDYFRLRGSLERRLYELARKHCGNQSRWTAGTEVLKEKCGARSALKAFRYQITNVAKHNHLPGYRVVYNGEKDQLTFYNRKGNKAAKAEFDEQMKDLFKPPTRKTRAKKTPKLSEQQLSFGLE
jgi:plasmid replication initiation protein